MIVRIASALLALNFLSACASGQPSVTPEISEPVVVIPSGVVSTLDPDQLVQMVLAEIKENERKLGRVLVPARILHIQLLRDGEIFRPSRLDGSGPIWVGDFVPRGAPGWMIEAVGTFTTWNARTRQIDILGAHGFYLFEEGGVTTSRSSMCWIRHPIPGIETEGTCIAPLD